MRTALLSLRVFAVVPVGLLVLSARTGQSLCGFGTTQKKVGRDVVERLKPNMSQRTS